MEPKYCGYKYLWPNCLGNLGLWSLLSLNLSFKFTQRVLNYSYYWQGLTSLWKWLSLCCVFCLAYYTVGERRKLLVGRRLFHAHVLKYIVSSPSLCWSGHCKQIRHYFYQSLLGGWNGWSVLKHCDWLLHWAMGCYFSPLQRCILGHLYDMDGKWKKREDVRHLLFMPWCRLLVGILFSDHKPALDLRISFCHHK